MTFRPVSHLLGLASLCLLATTALPVRSVNAQDDNASDQQASAENQQDSAQQSKDPSQGEDQSSQQPEPVQLKVIPLKHVQYNELRSMMQLKDPNYLSRVQQNQRVHVSHDNESKTLFIRAPQQRLQEIEEFITRVDVPPEEFPKEIQFGDDTVGKTVSREVGDRATRVLEQLGYPVSMQFIGNQRMLVIRSEKKEVRDEINTVIEAFAKKEEKKKESGQENQGQEKEAQDKEAQDKEAQDKEAQDKEAQDKEAQDKEAQDKEAQDS